MIRPFRLFAVTRLKWLAPAAMALGPYTNYPVEFLTADGKLFATADGIQFGVPA
jgi:hypothetical protein